MMSKHLPSCTQRITDMYCPVRYDLALTYVLLLSLHYVSKMNAHRFPLQTSIRHRVIPWVGHSHAISTSIVCSIYANTEGDGMGNQIKCDIKLADRDDQDQALPWHQKPEVGMVWELG